MVEAILLQYLFLGFNFLFLVIGTIILGFGIWMHVDTTSLITVAGKVIYSQQFENIVKEHDVKEKINELLKETLLKNASYALIVFGVIIFAISFCGFFGAKKESKLLLIGYSLSIIVMMVAQICVFIALMHGKFLHKEARDVLKDSIGKYNERSPNAMSKLWDITHVGLNCCGIDGVNTLTSDFKQHQVFSKTGIFNKDHRNIIMPISCCKFNQTPRETLWTNIIAGNLNATLQNDGCREKENFYHDKGCFDQLRDHFKGEYFGEVVASFVGVLVFEILAIVFACLIRVRKNERFVVQPQPLTSRKNERFVVQPQPLTS